MKEALFYKKLKENKVQCNLCPMNCTIENNKTGFCGVRKNTEGKLYSLVYAKPCSTSIDPIEKKPFFHFAPGSQCLSVATVGCNLACSFCQNNSISHPDNIFGENLEPEEIIKLAINFGAKGIAYTYTEPTIFYEFALDIMKLAKKKKLYNVWVSNGYTNPEPAKKAASYMDAINVDIKGDIKFYQKLCSVPDEEPMHRSLKIYKEKKVFIEITNLMIPGFNDKPEQIKNLVSWVKTNLGKQTPLHFSRFHPAYKLTNVKPTDEKTLENAYNIAKDMGMDYVYVGNIFGHKYESTYCPKCGKVVIERRGYQIVSKKNKCSCGQNILIKGKRYA